MIIDLNELNYKKEININFEVFKDEALDKRIIDLNYLDCYEKMQNTLDLKQLLWQNIVLEVPISYTLNNDANLKGNGWELINDKNIVKDEIDPRLKKLEDLLKGDD